MGAITRRDFMKSAVAAGAVATLPSSHVLGANDSIRVGLIGCGGRGAGAHLPGFAEMEGVDVVAVSDPDRQRMAGAAKAIESRYGGKAEQYVDMRELLDRKDIDVIANATQNYWHGLSTIWACQAGKHVYVEKPLSHYIWEGRQMVNAARKYDRIVQCGTQHRSEVHFIEAIQWIREGHLGAIKHAVAFDNKPRTSCGKRETPLPIPESIDYDLWCGPAQKVPIYRDRLQYDCSFDWNTGDGESCNQGVHEIDVARWCLGEEGLPRRVISLGGRFTFNDACDVPNSQITGGNISNYTVNGTRRIDMVIGVSYEDDLKKAQAVIAQVLAGDDRILPDPAPMIAVSELADSSVNFVVRPWVKVEDYWPAYFDLTRQIKVALDENSISIPYPQRDIHVKDGLLVGTAGEVAAAHK